MMEFFAEWSPSIVLFIGGMSIVCTIIHVVQSTLRPPQCCHNSTGTLVIGLPQLQTQNPFKYVRLESQKLSNELESWHNTPYPVYTV